MDHVGSTETKRHAWGDGQGHKQGQRHERRAAIGLFLALVCHLGMTLPAQADTGEHKDRLAIVVTLTVNASQQEAGRLASALESAIEQVYWVEAIAGEAVQKRAPSVPEDCIIDPACIRELTGKLNVRGVFLLTIVRVGEQFQIAITWGNGADGRSEPRPTVHIDVNLQDPVPAFVSYAGALLPGGKKNPPRNATDSGATEPSGKPLPANEQTTLPVSSPRMQPEGRRVPLATWILGGVSVAALAGGVGFGLAARSAYSDLEGRNCKEQACREDDIDSLERRGRIADILVVTAAVSATVGAILYWRSGQSGDTNGVALGVSGSAALVTYGGQF